MTLATVAEPTSDLAAKKAASADIIEAVLIKGDIANLTKEERVAYYRAVCDSVGLNPLTRPFDYLNLSGKLTLYARKDATEQLRRIHGISVERLEHSLDETTGVFMVIAYGRDREGRTDSSTGAVCVSSLKGEALSNAYMKAETKAKRRLTLSMAGLGWLDESEIESIPSARPGAVNLETGEIQPIPLSPPPTAWKDGKGRKATERKLRTDDELPPVDDANDAAFDLDSYPPTATPEKVSEAASAQAQTPPSVSRVSGGGKPPVAVGTDPKWLDEPLPRIQSRPNWAGKSWRWLTEGPLGGDRMDWVSGVVDNPQAPRPLKLRCEFAMIAIAERAKAEEESST